VPLQAYDILFSVFAFIFGAVVGSFLNVCIYRMPLNLSVNEPKRSFCPHCKKQIPWTQNIPIFSWLFLRGRCASCGTKISPRYLGVELLTALLFLAVYRSFPAALVLPYCVLLSLFVVATFIDFDHFIIPDEITWGGTFAGIIFSAMIPSLMNTDNRLHSLLWSVAGAAAGYGLLWCVVHAGKLAFGRKKVILDKDSPFTLRKEEEDLVLDFGEGEELRWSELFSRESDMLRVFGKNFIVNGEKRAEPHLDFYWNRLRTADGERDLEKLESLSGVAQSLIIPREAMGFGDVKFIAAIGAFLGWKAVLFTVFAASILGSIVGVGILLLGKKEWSVKIPFGPYLAAGATIWMFAGPQVLDWYFALLDPGLPY
jgi:leader peptidase (prepilin peptidase)/N-methyltransferase